MKHTLLVVILGGVMACSGCYNTRRGFSKDVIAHEAATVRKMENKLSEVNPAVVEDLTNITAETAANTATWHDRYKAAKKMIQDRMR